jgi:replicative DNA helicase
VIVDYIGLIKPTDKRKPRWETVTETSNAIKSLALSLGVPIIALCQLNRDAEGETPKLSHLRESGAIEQDADVVVLLDRHRDSIDAKLHIAKIRNGCTGVIHLRFDGAAFKFSE